MQRPRKFKNVIRFNDMKILHKLLYSFLLVALIAAIIGRALSEGNESTAKPCRDDKIGAGNSSGYTKHRDLV